MSRIHVRNKEAVAMMLRQQIESGWADPIARSTLYKLQRAPGDFVDLDPKEIEAILDVYGSFADNQYWTPTEEYPPLYRSLKTYKRETQGPTGYPEQEEEGY